MSANLTVRDRPPRVLVMEDDPAIAKMLRFSLGAARFDVAAVTAGTEALNILKEQGATDAVVLDLGFPDGLGKAVIDYALHIQRRTAPQPGIGSTGPLFWVRLHLNYTLGMPQSVK